ncbi:MAG: hypothetical protein J0L79_03535 [Rickettsiales bacterium]|nr:hypothetical protein [Rickettsiales bacterium]MCA0254341.1 hypothetical protein [Pseudomonadota bacterium]
MKIEWEDLMRSFDNFEKNFQINHQDENLIVFFDDLAKRVINSNLSAGQLGLVVERINKLRSIFKQRMAIIEQLVDEEETV